MVKASSKNNNDFWKFLKLGKNDNINPIHSDNWVRYFTSLFNNDFTDDGDNPQINWSSYIVTKRDTENLNDKIDISEVLIAIKVLKDKKATGIDGIPNEFF